MSEYANAKTSIQDRVGVLTIDHPPANALNAATMGDLEAAFGELSAHATVKVIVITGGGRFAFVAGADIKEIAAIEAPEQAYQMVRRGQEVFDRIQASQKPVIAAVNGLALGGGLELAMACHLRILSDQARVGQPEINLGIIPGFGGTQRLPRLVGSGRALELILTGEMIGAEEAYRIGLANRVVPADQVLAEAIGLGQRIAAKSAMPVRAALQGVMEGLATTQADGLLREASLFSGLVGTHDFREGPAAFLEKHQPDFIDQ